MSSLEPSETCELVLAMELRALLLRLATGPVRSGSGSLSSSTQSTISTYETNLVQYVNRSLEEEEFHFLRFEFLQRLNIAQIQLDLIRTKRNIKRQGAVTSDDGQQLRERLRDYAIAIRDYQFLRNKKGIAGAEKWKRKLLLQRYLHSPTDDFDEPFESHYSRGNRSPTASHDGTLACVVTYSHKEKAERSKEDQEGQLPKDVSTPVDRLARFLIALVGGCFLIVPMVIMALDPSQTKSLVTVALAVLLLILLLPFGIRVSNVETLGATATYAAVLVVFVGTTGGAGGSDATSN
ncbi:hypothetical protein B0H66DRAFT_601339 [Apodospora peruviana]|uniref:DUF6594 domain-containing protein n=1 Tax=Apodospora peruviana TaxID=516989 RepID=A0AAE0M771_9PEZI|nr:hypothetical protein B0H66DRAFT_601339 [Apodospora peruviana]